MILLLTSLISQQRSFCKVSNSRGWALSLVCQHVAVRLEGVQWGSTTSPLGSTVGLGIESLEPAKCQQATTRD